MPQKFYQVQYGENLSGIISDGKYVERIVNFTYNQVFEKAFVNTCILVLSKKATKNFRYIEVIKVDSDEQIPKVLWKEKGSIIPTNSITKSPWVLKS